VGNVLGNTRFCRRRSISSVSSVRDFRVPKINLSDGAEALLSKLREALEGRLGEDGDLRPVADWIARHPDRVVRIAGLLHLTEHPLSEPISKATMQSAARIATTCSTTG
jgi:hypothetical protein